jgi:hypothetical protein
MGPCCSRPNQIEEMVYQHLKSVKLCTMNYEEVYKTVFEKIHSLELNEDFKLQLSSKNLNAFENSLSQISKQNFMKIANQYFYDSDANKNPFYTSQKSYFENISDLSNSNRYLALFNIFSLIKDDEDKMHKFLHLIKKTEHEENLKYQKFKNIIFNYVKTNLIVPTIAIKDYLSKHDPSKNTLLEDCDNLNKNTFSDENVRIFVDTLLEDFERLKFYNDEESTLIETYIIKEQDISLIFSKKNISHIFNLFEMRNAFLHNYT